MGVIFNGISQLGNEHLAVIRSSGVAVLQGFGYCGSSIRTRAFGRYIEGGCCRGVTVMRGSTVLIINAFASYSLLVNKNSLQIF